MAPAESAASTAPFIQTVAGRIPPMALGQTLAHEHLLVDWPWALGQNPVRCETRAVIDYIVSVLNKAHEHGISACVDVGTELFGPSPMALIAIAAQTPVHIVCSTGCFAQDMLPAHGGSTRRQRRARLRIASSMPPPMARREAA